MNKKTVNYDQCVKYLAPLNWNESGQRFTMYNLYITKKSRGFGPYKIQNTKEKEDKKDQVKTTFSYCTARVKAHNSK